MKIGDVKAAFNRVHRRIDDAEEDIEEHERILRGNTNSIGLRAEVKILKDYMKEIRLIFRALALMVGAQLIAAIFFTISQAYK